MFRLLHTPWKESDAGTFNLRDSYKSSYLNAPLHATAVAARPFAITSGAWRAPRNPGSRKSSVDSSIYTAAVPHPPISIYRPQVAVRRWELRQNRTLGSRCLPPNESPPTESDHSVADENTRLGMPRRHKKLSRRASEKLSQPQPPPAAQPGSERSGGSGRAHATHRSVRARDESPALRPPKR